MVLDVSATLNQSKSRGLNPDHPFSLNSCQATTCEISRDAAELGLRPFAKTPIATPKLPAGWRLHPPLMTLGFDPGQKRYVGTFIGSMMTPIWPFRGSLDASGKRLPLWSEGPKFDGSGIGEYRDTIEIIDGDTWHFSSELMADDGQWVKFMDGRHVRPRR